MMKLRLARNLVTVQIRDRAGFRTWSYSKARQFPWAVLVPLRMVAPASPTPALPWKENMQSVTIQQTFTWSLLRGKPCGAKIKDAVPAYHVLVGETDRWPLGIQFIPPHCEPGEGCLSGTDEKVSGGGRTEGDTTEGEKTLQAEEQQGLGRVFQGVVVATGSPR